MLFKTKNETWLFISPIEILNLYKDSIEKLRRVKLGESLIIHDNKHEDFKISVHGYPVDYNYLINLNKLLKELLMENETDLKQIESAQGIFRASKND